MYCLPVLLKKVILFLITLNLNIFIKLIFFGKCEFTIQKSLLIEMKVILRADLHT